MSLDMTLSRSKFREPVDQRESVDIAIINEIEALLSEMGDRGRMFTERWVDGLQFSLIAESHACTIAQAISAVEAVHEEIATKLGVDESFVSDQLVERYKSHQIAPSKRTQRGSYSLREDGYFVRYWSNRYQGWTACRVGAVPTTELCHWKKAPQSHYRVRCREALNDQRQYELSLVMGDFFSPKKKRKGSLAVKMSVDMFKDVLWASRNSKMRPSDWVNAVLDDVMYDIFEPYFESGSITLKDVEEGWPHAGSLVEAHPESATIPPPFPRKWQLTENP